MAGPYVRTPLSQYPKTFESLSDDLGIHLYVTDRPVFAGMVRKVLGGIVGGSMRVFGVIRRARKGGKLF